MLATFLIAGCSERPTITTYESPAVESRARREPVEVARARLDHMLAAIVPAGEQAWFFKLVASADEAARLREPFRTFLKSVDAAGKDRPTWKLADGWTEQPGDAVRAATIEIPSQGGKPLELTVSTLPLKGEWAPFLAANVNRWMGQLQQSPLDEKTVVKLAQKAPTKSGDAAMFELVGVMQISNAMMPAGHPPIGSSMSTATAGAKTGRVAEDAAIARSQGNATPPTTEFNYKLPANWSLAAGNPMRKATFVIDADGQHAETSVTAFPATASMSDPLENARRWAAQVGAPTDDESLKSNIEQVTVGGLPGSVMAFAGAGDDAAVQAIVAAMVEREGQVWFFKLSGPAKLVKAQMPAFRDLLASVRFLAK